MFIIAIFIRRLRVVHLNIWSQNFAIFCQITSLKIRALSSQRPGAQYCGTLYVKTGFLQISAMQNTQWLRVKNENSLTVKSRLNAVGNP